MSDLVFKSDISGIPAKVLLISDDIDSARIWCYILKEKYIETIFTSSPEKMLHVWAESIPDLIVIDMLSNEFDGIGLVRQLHAHVVVPVLLLTPIINETHILEAYHVGVDECVLKPISPALFLVKVKAWLRRTRSMPMESLDMLQAGGLQLDPTHRQVIKENKEIVKLTNLEFRLLHLLMHHPGWVFTTEEIIKKV